MTRYLIDANLPVRVPVWQGQAFQFVAQINDEWTDTQIWEYAKSKDLVIVTKDADFSHRIMTVGPPPKVIQIRVGNLRLRDFVAFIAKNWEAIKTASETSKLVFVYSDRIESVS